jgi:hypothetical protein
MNGKFILLLILSINIVSIVISMGLFQAGNDFISNNYMVEAFVQTGLLDNPDNLLASGSTELNDGFESSVEGFTKQESSGTGSDLGFFNIIDGLKIIFSFVSIITPLPILAFFASLGMPIWINLIIGLPIFILYIISIAEFIGNRNF